MKPIIEVQNLSKKYKIGATQPRYLSLRDSLTSTFKGVKNWANFDKSTPITNEFWALQNIDFQVNAGESIGIIGRNGAGKSTLLKILSRITPPTKGHAILRGRLASLLEVGTGFHPELTGRENVYFNGSILGLKKTEIDKKFDEIVDFSGIERFIDTPLKNYSSGMQLRLAFAVAAHLEPEILIIDEVLAVGDAEFQKKCLGKMDEVSKSGRTVLFVSHNLGYVANICQKCILLDKGRNIYMDKTDKVIDHYLNADAQFSNLSVDLSNENIEDDFAKLLNVRFIDSDNNALNVLFVDTGFGLEFTYQIKKAGSRATANFLIKTNTDEKVFQSIPNNHSAGFESGIYKAVCWFYGNLLNDTIYKLVSALTTHNPTHIHCQFETTFEVFDNPNAPTRGDYRHKMHGVVRPLLRWQSEKIND